MSESLEVHHHDPAPGAAQRGTRDHAQPVFYYDLASPDAYLAAERLVDVMGVVPEWQPLLLADLPGGGSLEAFRCAAERDIYLADVERRAAEQGLQPLRWPPDWPPDSRLAMSVATYAKQIGRAVAFSLAAFRQAFAAARDLSDRDSVVIAAAACEMHPAAVLKAAELRSVREALSAANTAAAELGIRELPAIEVAGEVFQGPDAPERAVARSAAA